jgi:hypothetical protein
VLTTCVELSLARNVISQWQVNNIYKEDEAQFAIRAKNVGVTVAISKRYASVSTLRTGLQQLWAGLARFIFLSASEAGSADLLKHFCSAPVLGNGIGWFVLRNPGSIRYSVCQRTVGWLFAQVSWNFQTSQTFAKAFHNITGKSLESAQHQLVEDSAFAWNSVLYLATAISLNFNTSTYPSPWKPFATSLQKNLKSSTAGPGVPGQNLNLFGSLAAGGPPNMA